MKPGNSYGIVGTLLWHLMIDESRGFWSLVLCRCSPIIPLIARSLVVATSGLFARIATLSPTTLNIAWRMLDIGCLEICCVVLAGH